MQDPIYPSNTKKPQQGFEELMAEAWRKGMDGYNAVEHNFAKPQYEDVTITNPAYGKTEVRGTAPQEIEHNTAEANRAKYNAWRQANISKAIKSDEYGSMDKFNDVSRLMNDIQKAKDDFMQKGGPTPYASSWKNVLYLESAKLGNTNFNPISQFGEIISNDPITFLHTTAASVIQGLFGAASNIVSLYDAESHLKFVRNAMFHADDNKEIAAQDKMIAALTEWNNLPSEERQRRLGLGMKAPSTEISNYIQDDWFDKACDDIFAPFHDVSRHWIEAGIKTNILDMKYADDEYGNFISRYLDNLKEQFGENFGPKFTGKGTDAIWQMYGSIIESAVSFAGPGAAIGKGVSLFTKGKSIAQTTEALLGKFVSASPKSNAILDAFTHSLLSGLISNRMESSVMGVDTYKQAMESFKPLIESGKISDQEARYLSAQAADNMEAWNLAFLASNMLEMGGLMRGKGLLYKDIASGNFMKDTWKNLTKLSFDNLLIQGGQEYAEEVGQGMMQNEFVYKALNKSGIADMSKYDSRLWGRLVDDFTSWEIQQQGLAGFFGGGIQRVVTKTMMGGYSKSVREAEKKEMERQKEAIQETQEFFQNRSNLLVKYIKALDIAQATGDKAAMDMLNDLMFTKMAVANFEAGTTEQLERTLRQIADEKTSMSDEELQKRGWDKDTYKQTAKDQLAQLSHMKKTYISMTQYENTAELFENRLNREIIARHADADAATLQQERSEHRKQLEGLIKTFAPKIPLKYDLNESGAVEEPILDIKAYHEETKGMSKKARKEFESSLHHIKRALQTNQDYKDAVIDITQLADRLEAAKSRVVTFDKEFEHKTSSEYQQDLKTGGKPIDQYTDTLLDNINKRARVTALSNSRKLLDKILKKNRKKTEQTTKTPTTQDKEEQQTEVTETKDESQGTKPIDKSVTPVVPVDQQPQDGASSESAQQKPNAQQSNLVDVVPEGPDQVDDKQDIKQEQPKEKTPSEDDLLKNSVSSTSINGTSSSGESLSLHIYDNKDGSKTSAIVINGQIADTTNHDSTVTDEQIIEAYKDMFDDPDITWETPENNEAQQEEAAEEETDESTKEELDDHQTQQTIAINQQYNEDTDESITEKCALDEPDSSDDRIKEGNNAVAHLHRAYETTTQGRTVSRKDADNEMLINNATSADFDRVHKGTELVFTVEDNNSLEMTHPETAGTGRKQSVSWGAYKQELKEKLRSKYPDKTDDELNDLLSAMPEYIQSVPIAIRLKDGTIIGYVHQTSWINQLNTQANNHTKEQLADREKSIAMRTQIVKQGAVAGTISERKDGRWFRTKNNIHFSVSRAMPDKNLHIAVASGGTLYAGPGIPMDAAISSKLTNRNNLVDGITYAIVQINKDSYRAIPLRQNKLANGNSDEETAKQYILDTIETVLKYSFRPKGGTRTDQDAAKEDELIKSINKTLKIDLSRDTDDKLQKIRLQQFLEIFLYMRNLGNAQNIDEFFSAGLGQHLPKTGFFVIGGIKGDIHFGTGSTNANEGRLKYMADIPKLMHFLRGVPGLSIYFNTNLEHLNKNSKIPIVTSEGKIDFKDYRDIVKENTNTNILGHDIGTKAKPKYVYNVHPVILFELKGDDAIQKSLPVNADEKKTPPTAQSKPTVKAERVSAKIKPNDEEFYVPASIPREEQESMGGAEDPFFIHGLPAGRQAELINYVVYRIANEIFDTNKTLNAATLFEKIRKEFLDQKEAVAKELNDPDATEEEKIQSQKALDILNTILNNWKKVQNNADRTLKTFNGIKFQDENGDEMTIEVAAQKENANWDNASAFTVDSKHTATAKLKRFFSGLMDSEYVEEVNPETGKAEKVLRGKKTFFGKDKPIGFDEAFEITQRLLSNQGSNKSAKSYIEKLRQHTTAYPFLHNLIAKLEATQDQSILNEFFMVMTKHYVDMRFMKIARTANGSYQIKVMEDNATAVFRGVQSTWFTNLHTSDMVISVPDPDAEEQDAVTSQFNQDIVNNIKEAFIQHKKTVRDKDGNIIYSITDRALYEQKIAKGIIPEADINQAQRLRPEDMQMARDILAHFGVTLSDVSWDMIVDGKYFFEKNKKPVSFAQFLTHQDSPIKVLLKSASDVRITEDDHPLNQTALKKLANFEADNAVNMYSNSHISNGKMVYSFSNNKYFIDRFLALKDDKKKLTELATSPYTKNNSWLKQLLVLDENGEYKLDENKQVVINYESQFYQNFSYWIASLAPLKTSFKTQDGKEMQQLGDFEHEMFNISCMQSSVGRTRTILVKNPTSSDKTSVLGFVANAVGLKFNQEDASFTVEEGRTHSNAVELLFENCVLPEIMAIKNFCETLGSQTGISGVDQGGALFYFMPTLNTNVENLFTIVDGKRTINPQVLSDPTILTAIKDEVATVLEQLIKDKLAKWEEYGIGVQTKNKEYKYFDKKFADTHYTTKDKRREAAADMVMQNLIATGNIYQLFVGNLSVFFAQAKDEQGKKMAITEQTIPQHIQATFTNIGKRLAGDIAPGETLFTQEDGTARYAFCEDVETTSSAIDYLEKILSKEKAGKYRNITATDGQELTTVREHVTILFKQGKITQRSYDAIIAKINQAKGGYYELDEDLLQDVLQPIKPVYVDNVYDSKLGMEVRYYIKSSSFPLLPQLTKYMDIDKVRIAMEKSGIDRLAFRSAVKSGAPVRKTTIFNKDGGIDKDLTVDRIIDLFTKPDANGQLSYKDLPRTGIKIQQDVPYKEQKDEINKVTQASKNLFTNILDREGFVHPVTKEAVTGRQLKKFYDSNYHILYQQHEMAVREEIDYEEHPDGSVTYDMQKLRSILMKEAIQRGWAISEVESIKHDKFFQSLPYTSIPKRYQALMLSVINTRIIKSKLPGMSSVLGTEAGFKQTEHSQEDFKKFVAKSKRKGLLLSPNYDSEKGLQPARIEIDESGNEVFKPAQAIVPWKLKDATGKQLNMADYVDENNMLDLSKIDPEILKIIGMRIPSQGPNSSSLIEIVGFTPHGSGDLFIATRDFVTQMGSDFDIDKIYSYITPIHRTEDGKLVKLADSVTEQELLDRINDFEAEMARQQAIIDEAKLDVENAEEAQKIISQAKKEISKQKNFRKKARKIYIKYIQSNIIDCHKSVLGNPKVQDQIAEPLSEWILGKMAAEFEAIKAKKDSPYKDICLLSDEYQKTKYINATAGKQGVAIFSLDNIFNSLCQYAGNMVMYENRKNGVEMHVKFGRKESYGHLSDERGFDANGVLGKGEYKSLIIQGYQSAAVDNEKLQILDKLNINNYTFNVIKLLNQLGFGKETLYLINQPIVLDYIHELSKMKGKFDEYTPNMLAKARELMIQKYSPEGVAEYRQDMSEYHADAGIDLYHDMMEFGDDVANYKRGESISRDEYYNTQCAILDKFLYLDAKGRELGQLESTSNIDSAGIGQTIPEMLIRKRNVDKVLAGKTNIEGAEDLFGTMVVNDDGEEVLDPNSINGFAYQYGLNFAAKIWSPFFQYSSPAFIALTDQISKFSTTTTDIVSAQVDLMDDAWDAAKAYLFSIPALWKLREGHTIQQAREALLFDTVVCKKIQVNEDRKKTDWSFNEANSNTSLARVIARLKNFPVGNNAYIRKLQVNIALLPTLPAPSQAVDGETHRSQMPSLITFNASAKEKFSEQEVYTAFRDLLENDRPIKNTKGQQMNVGGIPYTTSMLAQDLILYAFLTGAKQEAIQFLKYVPPAYLHATGIFDKLSMLNFNDASLFGFTEEEDTPSTLTKQFFQHYPEKAPKLSDFTKNTINRNSDSIETLVEFELPETTEVRNKGILPRYIAIYNNSGYKSYKLYELVGQTADKNYKYKQISTLGTFGSTEFAYGVPYVKSMIRANRAKQIKAKANETLMPIAEASDSQPVVTIEPTVSKRLTGQEAVNDVKTMLNAIIQDDQASPLHIAYAKDLLSVIDKLNEDPNRPLVLEYSNQSSYWYVENTLRIDKDLIAGVGMYTNYKNLNNLQNETLLHELTHGFLSRVLNLSKSDPNSLTNTEKEFAAKINDLYEKYKHSFETHPDPIVRTRYEIYVAKTPVILEVMRGNLELAVAAEKCRAIEKEFADKLDIVDDDLKKALFTTADEVKTIMDLANRKDKDLFYAAHSASEFCSEMMANQSTIEHAAKIPLTTEEQKKGSVVSQFMDAVRKFVKSLVSSNVADRTIDEILGFIKQEYVEPTQISQTQDEKSSIISTLVEGDELFPDDNTTEPYNGPIVELNVPVGTVVQSDVKFFNMHRREIEKYFGFDNLRISEFRELIKDEPSLEAFYAIIKNC